MDLALRRLRLVLRMIALILPLGLDTFAISAAIGVAGIDARKRLRLSLIFAAFEGLMPLIGFVVGAGIGHAIGSNADYVAGVLLILLGGYMLWPREETDELEAALSMTRAHGLALLGLGISISLDELAIGFSAGLLRIPILAAVVLIALQAFVLTQLGVRLGSRVGERFREAAEQLAGIALFLLGVLFLSAPLLS